MKWNKSSDKTGYPVDPVFAKDDIKEVFGQRSATFVISLWFYLRHQTAILKNNPKKLRRSVGEGEALEFDVVQGIKVIIELESTTHIRTHTHTNTHTLVKGEVLEFDVVQGIKIIIELESTRHIQTYTRTKYLGTYTHILGLFESILFFKGFILDVEFEYRE